MNDAGRFARSLRRLALAWLALIALMLLSLASAYVPLGAWNLAIGLGIAALKAAIVLWCFMRLAEGSVLLRLVAASGAFALALLVGLGGLDEATRATEPAPLQQPRQLPPLKEGGPANQ